MNYNEVIKRLREPFNAKEIEWKIQVTSQDKNRGMAVAYMNARAVQKRLDEVVGAFSWKNVYSLWHDNSQICGISIFNDERSEWITKFDGAENSDIEPIKGGLSDSFKRAATVWGVGRYLYEMEGVWVEIEPRGKSFAIKQNQYGRLENEYNAAVKRIFGGKSNSETNNQGASAALAADNCFDRQYKVLSVKPSGKSSQVLELTDSKGATVKAYIKAADQAITAGVTLSDVKIEIKNSNYGDYNLISSYKLAA